MATYYLLTLYMQQVLEFTPVMAGMASLPVAFGIFLSAGVSSKLVEHLAPRAVAAPGLLVAAAGLYWLSTLAVGSSYVWHVLPALFVTYFGLGMGFMPMTLAAVHGVTEEWAGVASAMINTAQQLGAALGALRAGDHLDLGSQRAAARSGQDPSGRPDGKRHERPGEGRRGADPRLHDGLPRRRWNAAGSGRHRDRGRQHPANPGRPGGGRRRLILGRAG